MKELSIEEKAKAYDEAIEKAKTWCDCEHATTDDKILLKRIFPELKESKDEKIRKALIHLVNSNKELSFGIDNYDGIKWSDVLAWLEKQGKPIDKIVKRATTEKQRVLLTETNGDANIDWDTRSLQDVKLLLEYGLDYIKKELKKIEPEPTECKEKKYSKCYVYNLPHNDEMCEQCEFNMKNKKLEKQGEQKDICDTCEHPMLNCQNFPCDRKQGEQKSSDTIEPKFKVGDWIVFNGLTLYVNEVVQGYYQTISRGGILNSYDWDIDNVARLWTIQDAKDGDMLYECNEKKPFIFKELKHIDDITSYCDIFNGIFNPNEDSWTTWDIVPATKKQRDLLFQKMKEAGYEWDAEKKELKMIEQKSNNKIKPIFNVGDKIQYSKGCGTIMTIEKIENGEYIFANNMGHTTIESGNKWHLVEQKPAEWTMDNIEELTEFENAMMHIGGSFFGEHQGLDPNDTFVVKEQAKILLEMAPKQEWSAKDENFLNTTIAYLRDAYSKDKIDFKDTAKNCVNWLKSLKDRVQPKQEWSEEDE